MPETRPDGLDLDKDGTITVHIDGDRYHLRRPKTGEYKAYLLESRRRDDELTELKRDASEKTTPPDGKSLDELGEEMVTLVDLARDLNRDIGDRQGELDRRWFGLVFNGDGNGIKGLSDKPLPDDSDQWPVWLWQADNLVKFIEHWRDVPLVRGS